MNKKQIFAIFLIGLILYLLLNGLFKTRTYVFFNQKKSGLSEVVEKTMDGTQGTYGIAIKNLKTGKSYSFNEKRVFEAGSLYKLWVMLTAFEQMEKGQLKEEEILSEDISSLNQKFNISSDSAEMTEGRITLSVKNAIVQMITISHNYAALLLTDRVKVSNVFQFLETHGFNDSKIGESPKTTPEDMALFLEKIYKEELTNKENTQKILEILKNQQLNNGLPKYLPQDIKVAHKTGDVGWFKHDAGIVFKQSGDYIIVVMSESDSPEGAQERIAQISKAVYEYFK